jgi:hypothetical protein
MKLLLLFFWFALSAQAVTFESWIATYGLTGASALETADPDNDGKSNLMEYCLDGLNPTTRQGAVNTTFGFAPANSDGTFGTAEQSRPNGAPRAWHHALVYRLRAGIEDVSVYPQISHECPATQSGGDLRYWLGDGGRDDAMLMVYTRPDGALQAMSRTRGHLQSRAFMRLNIVRDGGLRMPVTEGAVSAFVGLTSGPLTLVPRTVGSVTNTNVTDRDLTYAQSVSAQTVTDVSWPWALGGSGLTSGQVTRSFSPSGIVTLGGSSDLWTYVAPGQVTLRLTTPSRVYEQQITVSSSGSITTREITGNTTGSLRAHLIAQTDTRAASYSAIAERAGLYSAISPGVSYTRNTQCWVSGVNMTPVAAWNSETAAYGHSWRGQTLVSPRHYIGAAHWPVSVGTTLHFITSANAVVARTVTARQIIAGTDIIVGLLDSDVPGTIAFARVLPAAWSAKLPTLSLFAYPCVSVDQGQRVWIRELAYLGSSVMCQSPMVLSRRSFYKDAVSGDSGSPCFLIVNNSMVLLCTWLSGGGGGGPSITHHRTAINAAMTALGGGYQLTDVSLSAFTSY